MHFYGGNIFQIVSQHLKVLTFSVIKGRKARDDEKMRMYPCLTTVCLYFS